MSNSKMELESLTPSRIDKVVKYNGSYLQWLARDKEFRTVMKTDGEAGTAVDDHWAVYIHLAGLFNLPTDVNNEAQTTALEPAAKKPKVTDGGGAAWPTYVPLFCMKHGTDPIYTWYDCRDCVIESDEWAKTNGFAHCVCPDTQCVKPGTDNGAWVTMNAGRWRV